MNKKTITLQKKREEVKLDGAGIDQLSALLAQALEQAAVDRKDVIRLRLAAEEILGLWQSRLGEQTVCTFRCGTRLGRMYLEITAPGGRIDPDEAAADLAGQMLCSNLLAQAGLSPAYSYQDGVNRMVLYPPSRRGSARCSSCCWPFWVRRRWERHCWPCPPRWERRRPAL